jgi:hypothetical protein
MSDLVFESLLFTPQLSVFNNYLAKMSRNLSLDRDNLFDFRFLLRRLLDLLYFFFFFAVALIAIRAVNRLISLKISQ